MKCLMIKVKRKKKS